MEATRESESDGGWLHGPCAFHLLRSYATTCCACEKDFKFMNRGYTCEFCGYFCHNSRSCSRKMWLSGELLRRRICAKCDRYRNVCSHLRKGAEFTLCGKRSQSVTLRLSEKTGELFMLQNETDKRVETVHLSRLVGARRGFSHGGHMRSANYDPLRSLSITVRKSKRDNSLTTHNLKASSAWLCQMWVEGLISAKYIHRRLEDQSLAREWYESRGWDLHSAGNRLLHNYLPRNSELKQFCKEKKQAEKYGSLCSADSGIDFEMEFPGSLEDLDLQESYVEIEVQPDSKEVLSREIAASLLFGRRRMSPPLSRPRTTSISTPTTPALAHSHIAHSHITSSRLPISTPTTPALARSQIAHSHISSSPLPISTKELVSRLTPGLPYSPSSYHSASSQCSCHAYQIITTSWSRPGRRKGGTRASKAGSAPSTPQQNRRTCCARCVGHCKVLADLENV